MFQHSYYTKTKSSELIRLFFSKCHNFSSAKTIYQNDWVLFLSYCFVEISRIYWEKIHFKCQNALCIFSKLFPADFERWQVILRWMIIIIILNPIGFTYYQQMAVADFFLLALFLSSHLLANSHSHSHFTSFGFL